MTFVYEKNYMYIETFDLDENETEKLIRDKLFNFDVEPYNIYINCVRNRNMEKLGYSYGWISSEKAFNILVGLNEDGSERIELVEDENWVQPEKKESDEFLWSDQYDQDPPLIKKYLDPLVDFEGLIIIKESFIINNYDRENIIYTKNIDKSITKNKLHKFFKQFDKDTVQFDKYPIIQFKEKNNQTLCLIKFSPRHPHTASFVINLVKKKKFNNVLCFFSQTKKHG